MRKRIELFLIGLIAILIIGIGICYAFVSFNASGSTYNKADEVPELNMECYLELLL